MSRLYPCMICERRYEELEEAELCERRHAAEQVAQREPPPACAFCDHAPCTCYQAEPPRALPPEELLRLGALTLDAERSEAVEQLLNEQEDRYRLVLRREGPEALIVALRDRDRLLANQGRQLSDGRSATRLLREFLRASLYRAGGVPNVQAIERVLEQFGMEAADAKQLRLHGGTLGPLQPPEQVAEELADGTRRKR